MTQQRTRARHIDAQQRARIAKAFGELFESDNPERDAQELFLAHFDATFATGTHEQGAELLRTLKAQGAARAGDKRRALSCTDFIQRYYFFEAMACSTDAADVRDAAARHLRAFPHCWEAAAFYIGMITCQPHLRRARR